MRYMGRGSAGSSRRRLRTRWPRRSGLRGERSGGAQQTFRCGRPRRRPECGDLPECGSFAARGPASGRIASFRRRVRCSAIRAAGRARVSRARAAHCPAPVAEVRGCGRAPGPRPRTGCRDAGMRPRPRCTAPRRLPRCGDLPECGCLWAHRSASGRISSFRRRGARMGRRAREAYCAAPLAVGAHARSAAPHRLPRCGDLPGCGCLWAHQSASGRISWFRRRAPAAGR